MPLRIGHKGAHALIPGNTVASFVTAVETGVDLIELDVLWTEDGHPSIDPGQRSELVVAHDWQAAREADLRGERLTLDAALAAFARPPLDQIAINLDIKLPGRDDDVVAAVHRHDLLGRARISTMEISTLKRLAQVEPQLSLGWTVPKVTKNWLSMPAVVRPALAMGLASVRLRMPGQVRRGLPDLAVDSVWAYFGVVTPRLVDVVHDAGKKLNVWTVDDQRQIETLVAMGVDGICSNDPRLLN